MDKREYLVTERQQVTEDIVSFVLKPSNGAICSFVPGQYLVVDLPALGLRREYSISFGDGLSYRITVKREAAPKDQPDAPIGQGSNWLHDHLTVGDTISAWGASGGFQLDRESSRPVVLMSGGVGITPVLSMLHYLSRQASRPTWFVHACENGDQHAYADEVNALVAQADNIHKHILYREPLPKDIKGQHYDSSGLVNKTLMQALLPLDNYEFYLCGPKGFMQAAYDILVELGVADESINYEFFGPATLVKAKPVGGNQAVRSTKQQPKVSFTQTGATYTWDPELENLLDFAEENNVFPNHSCRFGTCGTCATKLVSGEVEYFQETIDDIPPGHVLLCSCAPTMDIEIEQ